MTANSNDRAIAAGTTIDEVARETGLMEILSEAECWAQLAGVEVGRLAVAAAGEVDIYPINFVLSDQDLIFRTAEGTKLLEIVICGQVAFEADGYDREHGRAWSVVIKGRAEEIEASDQIYAVERLPLFPWNAAPKERVVRIRSRQITGRRFTVVGTRDGSEPQL
jgi:nitroimidazol reductase NimA-like FMN-containing flavoprotein (pyridoxamine 5'-phosphate oxidase superfamily)